MNNGIQIGTLSYNTFCYADDILLSSLTVTGLQRLIESSNNYITAHGLRFNPTKTFCAVYGKPSIHINNPWTLAGEQLEVCDKISYLGAIISDNSADHVTGRVRAARRAFYLLQSSGLCCQGVNPLVIAHIWSVAVRPVLTYGCSHTVVPYVSLKQRDIDSLEKTQGALLKVALGLPKVCRNSRLLAALNISRIATWLSHHT